MVLIEADLNRFAELLLPKTKNQKLKTVSFPFQGALAPDVHQAHRDDTDEYQHLHEPEPAQGLEHHRPGVEENGFNVEHDEEHGDDVEAHRVTAAGVADGGHAA